MAARPRGSGTGCWPLVLAALLPLLLLLTHSPSAAAAQRAPLVATWVTLSPVAASPWDGVPSARCDHTFASLTGLSFRRNGGFPGVNGGAQPASSDPFRNTFWMFGGHTDVGLTDSWLLDIGVDPPTWSKLNYSSASVPVGSRWSTPVGFIPKAPGAGGAVGLNAVMFGGANGLPAPLGYDGDVPVFNFANRSWSKWAQTPPQTSDSVPWPRGWTSWIQLPEGFGTGHIPPDAPDSGSFFLFGGLGARDGVHNGPADVDSNDEWIYHLPTNRWTRLDTQLCLLNRTTCSDDLTLGSLITQFANKTGSPVNLTAAMRPADVISVYSTLLQSMLAENSTVAALSNDDRSCMQSCARFQTNSTIKRPPVLEGTRMGIIGTNLYLFGGYSCSENGVISTGGDSCFVDSMWILEMRNMTWTEVTRAAASPSSAANWPSRRAYNVLVAHVDSGLIIVQGGWYLDLTGVAFYYNDVFAFDVFTREWIPVKVQGVPPQLAWSANADVLDDDVYLSGGCLNANYWSQLVVLKLGLALQAANCYASGPGLTSAVAGQRSSFTIQTREFVYNETGLAPSRNQGGGIVSNGTVVFGANATYGTGLTSAFSVLLVTSSTASGAVVLVTASVVEAGAGLYLVSYTAQVGRVYQMFISLDNVPVPGSPFVMTLRPDPMQVGPGYTAVSGLGAQLVEKGGIGALMLSICDSHGNGFTDSSFLLANSPREASDAVFSSGAEGSVAFTTAANTSFVISASLGLSVDALSALQFNLLNLHNGSMVLSYTVPSQFPGFVLAVQLNGVGVVGSPFTVQALTPLKIPNSLVVALWCLAFFVILLCGVCSVLVYWLRKEPVMRSSSPRFLQLLLLGSSMSSLTVVFLADEGRDSSCQASHTVLTTGLVLAMAALLAKSNRVMRIFNAKKLKVPSNLSDAKLLIPTLGITGVMLLLNLLWIGIDPQRSEYRPSANYPQVLQYRLCTSNDLIAWVAIMLSFCGVGLLYGVKIAIGVSKLPEQFDESKAISSSLYNTSICCIFTVPLMFFLGSSSDFVVGRLILQSLVILWVSSFNVVALIGPKLLLLARLRWSNLPSTAAKSPGGGGAGAVGSTAGTHSSAATKATGTGAAAHSAKHATRSAIQMDPLPRGSIRAPPQPLETDQLNGGGSDSAADTLADQGAASSASPRAPSASASGSGNASRRTNGFDDVLLTSNPAIAGGVGGGRPTHAASTSTTTRPLRNLPPLPPVRGSAASVAPAPAAAPAAATTAAAPVSAPAPAPAVAATAAPHALAAPASHSPVVFPSVPPPPPLEEDDEVTLPEPSI